MKTPFLVVGLPRSRTAWLARFLTHAGRVCHHEPSIHWSKPADLADFLARGEGASDCMMTWLAHDAKRLRPDMPLVVIRREWHAAAASMRRLHKAKRYLEPYLAAMDLRLDQIEDELDCASVPFEALDSPLVCGAIYRRCLGKPMPMVWWRKWAGVNVQADIAATLKVFVDNAKGIEAVYPDRHWERA